MSAGSNPSNDASDPLWSALYQQLKAIAIAQVAAEFGPRSLQPTALVNEAWLRMADLKMQWQSHAHFLAMASRVMRRVLVDQARANRAAKRDDRLRVTLSSQLGREMGKEPEVDLLDVHEALTALASEDPRKAEVIEMHYFGGMSYPEIAPVLEVSEATVKRDLRTARAWLTAELATRA
ncbi:MAG: ECF-type sigma factor [Xanthomonadales bacterium]|nr:ECF-type sigma factor [Xanthomonadales bacterium]